MKDMENYYSKATSIIKKLYQNDYLTKNDKEYKDKKYQEFLDTLEEVSGTKEYSQEELEKAKEAYKSMFD